MMSFSMFVWNPCQEGMCEVYFHFGIHYHFLFVFVIQIQPHAIQYIWQTLYDFRKFSIFKILVVHNVLNERLLTLEPYWNDA